MANKTGNPYDYLTCGGQVDIAASCMPYSNIAYGDIGFALPGIKIISVSYEDPRNTYPGAILVVGWADDVIYWDTIGNSAPFFETMLHITVYDTINDEYIDLEVNVMTL